MKNILITGANGNLGSATVKKFLDSGYKVIGIGKTAKDFDFAAGNSNFELHGADLTNEDETTALVDTLIAKHGKIDGALLLAGGYAGGGLNTTTGEDIRKMYALNFETAYFTTRPLFDHMMQNGYGRIVLIGARPALKAQFGKSAIAYGLSKSLLFKLAEYLNETAKGKNVVVSVVAPSTIDTPPNRQGMPDAKFDDWVKPEHIADLLEYICSEKGLPLREPVYKVYNNA